MSSRKKIYIPTIGLTLHQFPNSAFKTVKAIQSTNGGFVMIDAYGKLYCSVGHTPSYARGVKTLKPGSVALGYAKAAHALGALSKATLDTFAKLSDDATKNRKLNRSADELENAADDIGIKFTKRQQNRIATVRRAVV